MLVAGDTLESSPIEVLYSNRGLKSKELQASDPIWESLENPKTTEKISLQKDSGGNFNLWHYN